MSQIIKAFTGIFMMLFIMTSVVGVLQVFFSVVQAQNYHSALIYELESSNHANSILKNGIEAGKSLGYQINYTLIKESGGVVRCTKTQDVPDNVEDIECVEVVLRYPVRIAFFEIEKAQELVGFAR